MRLVRRRQRRGSLRPADGGASRADKRLRARPAARPARLPRARVRRREQRVHVGRRALQPRAPGPRRAQRRDQARRRPGQPRVGGPRRAHRGEPDGRRRVPVRSAQHHRTESGRAHGQGRSGPHRPSVEQDHRQLGRPARVRHHRDAQARRLSPARRASAEDIGFDPGRRVKSYAPAELEFGRDLIGLDLHRPRPTRKILRARRARARA
uniref:SOD n=1 Tax=Lymantria dispar multicapsid nuclear polyhedrosis virus TaxID=10449 RepID=A0A140HQJ5_NPVLD|nr:SOD [Lymantria dispar multiple nucleopolyhedrovirus]